MLTHKQHHLLGYLRAYHASTGIMPSLSEMCGELGLRSKSGVHRLLSGLEERGAIRRLPNRARAIEVLRAPMPREDPAPAAAPAGDIMGVPLLGRLGPGEPVPDLGLRVREVGVPQALLGHGEHFALTVSGNQMDGAGIRDGDLAVFRRQEAAGPGDAVAAVLDGSEAVLRRYMPRGNTLALVAAHPDCPARIVGFDRVRVIGRLVTILRDYR